MLKLLAILLLFSVSAHGQLRCFDCSPVNVGSCVDPQKQNAKETLCGTDSSSESGIQKIITNEDKFDIDPRIKTTESKYTCFSMYFESFNGRNPSGVYRGCEKKSDKYLDICEHLRDEFRKEGNVTRCEFCDEEMCNVQYVGGAAAILLSPLLVLLVAVFQLLS